MRKIISVLIILITTNNVIAQNRNSIWAFGDSAGIDFNSNPPVAFYSVMDGRGSCSSISDIFGNLLLNLSMLLQFLLIKLINEQDAAGILFAEVEF